MSLLGDRRLLLALGAAAVAATVYTVYYFVGASAAALASDEEEEDEDEASDSKSSALSTGPAALARASPSRVGSAASAAVSSSSSDGVVSAAAFTAMLRELADKLEAFQEKMAPKAEEHMGSEAGFEAYQRAVTEGIQSINEEVERAHGMDRAAAARAQEAHSGNEEVATQMARVKRVIFGDEDAGDSVDVDAIEVPPGMTADSFFELFSKHVATVERAYAEIVEEARRSVKDRTQDPDALATYLKLLLQRKMPEILARAQAAVALEEDVFRNCLMKFQGVRACRIHISSFLGVRLFFASTSHARPLSSSENTLCAEGLALHRAHSRVSRAAAGAAQLAQQLTQLIARRRSTRRHRLHYLKKRVTTSGAP